MFISLNVILKKEKRFKIFLSTSSHTRNNLYSHLKCKHNTSVEEYYDRFGLTTSLPTNDDISPASDDDDGEASVQLESHPDIASFNLDSDKEDEEEDNLEAEEAYLEAEEAKEDYLEAEEDNKRLPEIVPEEDRAKSSCHTQQTPNTMDSLSIR